MFDDDLRQVTDRELIAAAATTAQIKQAAGCHLLEIAAEWADRHPGNQLPLDERINLHGERQVLISGDGTPSVAEFAPTTLGLEIGLAPYQARALVPDALDLRHRLPLTWRRVQHADVPAERAQRLAYKTRHLSPTQAGDVDRALSGYLSTLVGKRLDNRIDAEILRVDRERQEQQARQKTAARRVIFGRPDEHGMCEIHIRTSADHTRATKVSLDRIATILSNRQDQLPPGVNAHNAQSIDEWRSVAATLLLENPILAAQLLIQDQHPDLLDLLTTADDAAHDGQAAADHDQTATDHTDRDHSGPPADQDHPGEPDDPDTPPESGSNAEAIRRAGSVDQQLLRHLIAGIDPTKLRPQHQLHVHLNGDALLGRVGADGAIARVEDLGPILLGAVRRWLGNGSVIKLQPILDPATIRPVDAYETPDRIREAVLTRTPASCFPHSTSTNRRNDLDHTDPYRPPPAGPPGQTGYHNLGPFARPEHRYKTFTGTKIKQPCPGTYLWRTIYGKTLITNDSGTHDLGINSFADSVWEVVTGGVPDGTSVAHQGEPCH